MFKENTYRSWNDFEVSERRRVATFQMSVDNLARDLYLETEIPDEEVDDDKLKELNFDY